MSRQRTIPELISHIKKEHAKAEKAQEHWREVGKGLAELKERKPKGITWPDYVKKHFSYSQTRADELIRIAGGTTTTEATRERKRVSMKKSRSKPAPRGAESKGNVVPFVKPQEGDCNYNPGDPDHVDSDTPQETRRIIFLNMVHYYGINEPTKVLDEAFFPEASPEEATDDLFVEIEKVIAAWKAIAAKLRTLKGARSEKVKVKA